MVTLTINRKPQGIFSKSPATPLQDKMNTAHNVKAWERISVTGALPAHLLQR